MYELTTIKLKNVSEKYSLNFFYIIFLHETRRLESVQTKVQNPKSEKVVDCRSVLDHVFAETR